MVVTRLLHCCYTGVTLLSNCCYTVVKLLSHSCHTLVTLLLHRGSDHGQTGGVCGGTTLCTSLEKGSGCVAVTVLEKNSYSAKE
jgi:hypothetical protein